MTEHERRADPISRRAVLAALPVSALLGGFAGAGVALVAGADGKPVAISGGTAVATPGAMSSGLPHTDATEHGIIGDGVTDNADALNQLMGGLMAGQDIVFPAGDYVVRNRLRLRSGVNLRGAGAAVTTIRLADGVDTTFMLMIGESNVQLSGLTFDGGSQSLSEVALQIDSCTDVVIEDCAFVRMAHAVHIYAASFERSANITIRRNHFSEISDFAVRVAEGASSVRIEDNHVTDVKRASVPSPAAFYVRGTDIAIAGNQVDSSEDSGVIVAGAGTENVSVVDNVMRTTLVCVFFGTGAKVGAILGNTLESAQDFGVHLFDREGSTSRTVVSQNQILSSGKSGIQVEGVTDFLITSNMIWNPGTRDGMKKAWRCGIVLTSTDGGPASDFVVSGNLIASEAHTSRMEHAIYVTVAAEQVRIVGNVLRGSRSEAVKIDRDLKAPYYVETDTEILTSLRLRVGPA
jgi:hypothetical protein